MRAVRLQTIRALALCAVLGAAISCLAHEATLKSGVDRANFDTSAVPGEDFFRYVNGNWIVQNPMPPEYSRWGTFNKLRDDNLIALRAILDELAASEPPAGSERQKLRDFYRTALDEKKLNEQGASPLAPELARIDKVVGVPELIAEVATLRASGLSSLFGFYVSPDAKRSDRYAAHLRQGGLGLPEKSYYLGGSEDSKKILAQYRDHVAKMLELLGGSPAASQAGADAVLKIETSLAEASRAPVDLRDREAQYNKKTVGELAVLAPHVDWNRYFSGVGVESVNEVIVGQPEFFDRLSDLMETVSAEEWRAYLRWHLIHELAPYLGDQFENEHFRFYSTVLRGVSQMQPRWKRAISTIDQQMGEGLGKLYAEKYFTPAAKQRMDELVKNLMIAYRERIETRDWMGADTKRQALAKLSMVTPKIGYPDKWRDYSGLEIRDDSYVRNVMRAEAFESRYRLSRLGKPVDKTEWNMTPQTVNASYSPSFNEITFPAGILQPPFFDPLADDAVNYGAIGAVIGHEITHGFDDQGSRSDGAGNLLNWWTAEDRARFTAKTDKLAAQYDACVAVDDLRINGKLTLGENIADLGGVTMAYSAYQKSLGGRPAPVIDGLTGAQRFFMGYAQVWRGAVRDADQRLLLRTDPHSPGQFRTLVPLSNIPAFYEAFDVKPGAAMYRAPEDRVEIW